MMAISTVGPVIHMVLEGVPPTDNHAYSTHVVKKGRSLIPMRTLTTEGKAYKTTTTAAIVRQYGMLLAKVGKDFPYTLGIILYLPTLNKGWPYSAKSRYKKLDALNRTKLLSDALADALGIDDSQFVQVSVAKVHSEAEATHIYLQEYQDAH
jgi:Holliday junction resolvase RusA-like endonuclease